MKTDGNSVIFYIKLTKQISSHFLFGARGTGKTIWTQRNYDSALFINLLDAKESRQYLTRPEHLIEVTEGFLTQKQQCTIVIDEIQKVPQLLDLVHLLISKYTDKIQFVLTGSSARKIKRQKNINLLAGRAILKNMHPYMASEMGNAFNIIESLSLGMLPLVRESLDPQSTLETYVSTYLEEEVKAESLVRNIGSFARFLEAIAYSHASLLNITNVSRDCQVKRTTVNGFIEILEDLLIAHRLPLFTKKGMRNSIARTKFYYFDTGIYNTIRPKGVLDNAQEVYGLALEGLVYQHLKAWCDYSTAQNKLYYWRSKTNYEVDFVVYGDNGLCAFEVKISKNVKPADLKGLKAFQREYPSAQILLLYMGQDVLKVNDILCVPCEFFLRNLVPNTIPYIKS